MVLLLVLVLVLALSLALVLVLVLRVELRSKDRNVCKKGASLSRIFPRAAQCCPRCREALSGMCMVGCCLHVQR